MSKQNLISSKIYNLAERLWPLNRSITGDGVRETLSITDRSYLLFNGVILKSGTSEFLANDEETRKLYLGKSFRLN